MSRVHVIDNTTIVVLK